MPATAAARESNRKLRQADRRARFLVAGRDLLGSGGKDAVTVRGVCSATRLTERYFYESFGTKDQFLVAIYDDEAAQAYTAITTALNGAPTEPIARARHFFGSFLDYIEADPVRARILAVEAMTDHALGRRAHKLAVHTLLAYLETTRGFEEGPSRDDVDIQLTAVLISGGVWSLVQAWLSGGLASQASRDRLVEHLVQFALRSVPVSSRESG